MRKVLLKGGPADGQQIEVQNDNVTSLQFGLLVPDKDTLPRQLSRQFSDQTAVFKIDNNLYCQSQDDKNIFNYAH